METSELLEIIGKEIISKMKKDINSNSGKLSSNIKFKSTETRISVSMPLYGKFVDEGTKPHMPPISAIRSWAEKKGLNVWGVAINIKKHGTKPHPFIYHFEDVILSYRKEIETVIGIQIGNRIYDSLKQTQK